MGKPSLDKYIILFIETGEPLYRWSSFKENFEVAVFNGKALACHGLHDFLANKYLKPAQNKYGYIRYIPIHPRIASYSFGLFTSIFVDAFKTKTVSYSYALPNDSWYDILRIPRMTKADKHLFAVVKVENVT